MGKFIGIDEILQGGTPNRPTHSTLLIMDCYNFRHIYLFFSVLRS